MWVRNTPSRPLVCTSQCEKQDYSICHLRQAESEQWPPSDGTAVHFCSSLFLFVADSFESPASVWSSNLNGLYLTVSVFWSPLTHSHLQRGTCTFGPSIKYQSVQSMAAYVAIFKYYVEKCPKSLFFLIYVTLFCSHPLPSGFLNPIFRSFTCAQPIHTWYLH